MDYIAKPVLVEPSHDWLIAVTTSLSWLIDVTRAGSGPQPRAMFAPSSHCATPPTSFAASLRAGDLHVSRRAFAQLGEIACWVEGCAKNIECDDRSELRQAPPARSTAAAGRSRDTSAAPAASLPY